MAQTSMKSITGIAFVAAALFCGFASAQDTGSAQANRPVVSPVDPTDLPEVGNTAHDWPKMPPEISLMSSQCSVPSADLATLVPGLSRTVENLGTTKKLRILAIGSSSTWGVGASSLKRNYPSRLEAIFSNVWKGVDLEIINRGVGGEIAAQTAARLLDEINLAQPDMILWQVGTNDALTNVPLEEFETTVRSTIAEVRKRNIDIVMVGLQYTPKYARHEHYFKIRKLMDTIASSENLLYVRRYRAMEFIANTKANLSMMASDNFHLNDLGYQCMAEHVAQAVVANLFVRRSDKSKALAGASVATRPN